MTTCWRKRRNFGSETLRVCVRIEGQGNERAMATTRYTVIDGEILSENRAGVKRDYVPDPLGSTLALLDNTQTQTDTFSYYPYGEVASRTGTTATPFQYIGTRGYYQDNSGRTYVRARHLRTAHGRWMTVDPLFYIEPVIAVWINRLKQRRYTYRIYEYANSSPLTFIDATGMAWLPILGGILAGVAAAAVCGGWALKVAMDLHPYNDKLAHCMANAIFTRCMAVVGTIVGGIAGLISYGLQGLLGGGIVGLAAGCLVGQIGRGIANLAEYFEKQVDPQDWVANGIGAKCGCTPTTSLYDCCKQGILCSGIQCCGTTGCSSNCEWPNSPN